MRGKSHYQSRKKRNMKPHPTRIDFFQRSATMVHAELVCHIHYLHQGSVVLAIFV